MEWEIGESQSLEYIASSREEAIEYCQKADQFFYCKDVYEAEVDSETQSDSLYSQRNIDGNLYFVDKDGFLSPIKK